MTEADQPIPAPPASSDAPSAGESSGKPVEELSAEEQMARFEKELKENDWGHQPC